MLRFALLIALIALSAFELGASCTVPGEGEGEGEGNGGGEGEGQGGCVVGPENTDAACSDGCDNDGNSFIDCADFACSGHANCRETACTTGNCCSDGLDNDGNNFTDCDDFACGGDPACDVGVHVIQDVQDGTVLRNRTVTVNDVRVTSTHTAGSGNISLFVQESDAAGSADTFPEDAGFSLFIPSANIGTFPDLQAGIAAGDCVSVTGRVDEFNGDTQLSNITALTKTAGCAAAPTPSVVTVATIATDTDTVAAGDQAAASAEAYEDVLVQVNNVTVVADAVTGRFRVHSGGAGPELLVSSFLIGTDQTPLANAAFTSIVGVFTEHDDQTTHAVLYQLEPRTAADLTP